MIICSLISQTAFALVDIEGSRSPVKVNDFFNWTTILPADFAASQYTISSGGFYKLSGNATVTTGSGTGSINITGNQVVLDLNGAAITGNDTSGIAINIAAGVKEVTIRNGSILNTSSSNAFNSAIAIGAGAAKIRIEDMTIMDCKHADGAIKMIGTSGASTTIKDVTLENVSIIGGTVGTAFTHINGDYIHGLTLNNVHSRNGANSTSGTLSGIKIQNSNSIVGTNVSSINHTGIADTFGVELISCNNVAFSNLDLSHNNGATGANTTGIKCTSCNNVKLDGVSISNLVNAKYGVWVVTSTDVILNNAKISGCASGTAAALTAILLDNSHSVKIKNSSIANNSGTTHFTGIKTSTASCKNILIDNIELASNTAVAGNCYGIHLDATLFCSILNSTIAQNDCSSTADSAFHVRGIFADGATVAAVNNLLIDNCNVSGNSRISTATNATSTVAGIWLNTVGNCTITNTNCNLNQGSAQAFGIYVVATHGLVLQDCLCNNNAAGVTGSAETGGIAALPSAGLYLWKSHGALVKNCQFIGNKSGNKNPGLGTGNGGPVTGTSIINVLISCSGFGIANVGESTSILNVGNTFINCIGKRNGTQISDATLATEGSGAVPPKYQGTGSARRCWESEAIEAGAIEQNTNGSHYIDCTFEANGLSKFVTSYGLCISNGIASKVEAPKISFCRINSNGFYGLFDNNPTTVAIVEGTNIANNGNTNTVAVATTAAETTRNWNVLNGTSMYQSVSNTDFSTVGIQANAKVNWNVTSTAAA